MTRRFYFLILINFLIFFNCTSSKNAGKAIDALFGRELIPIGRYAINNAQGLELISSAVHFGFTFEGSECEIFATVPDWLDHNYLQYEMDGVYQKRIKISKDSQQPINITTGTKGNHTVWIYKATEVATGPVFIQKITGENIKPIEISKAPLIEFIGNSITCGAAADASEIPCGSGTYHDQHNAYYAYGPRVARTLGTNFIVSSVSGIGIYRTWNAEEPSMPKVYEKTDFQLNSTRTWDFNRYTPQIVSIALGTNDLSNGDGKTPRPAFDSTTFVNNYINFVRFVKSKYPNAQIALLNSPMVGGIKNILLENCLTTIKNKIDNMNPSGKKVALYFFKPMQGRGCTGHPSVEDHAIIAEELFPFFKKMLE